MQEFQEGLGRAAFVCGALDYDRPFLAPLCAFAARHAPNSVKPLPLYVLVTIEYQRRKLQQRRHCECGLSRTSWSQAWRVDAHADEEGVGVGGWWAQANDKGLTTAWNSLVSCEDHTRQLYWAFQRDGKDYRVMATFEALGLLLALLAFGPGERLDNTVLKVQVPAFTDKEGNGHVINKLMTTRFPLCTVVMELAEQAELRGVRMAVECTLRERNQEADDLSNLLTSSFHKQVKINLKGQSWLVLPQLMEALMSVVIRDDVMRTSDWRSLFVEQFLQDRSTQREIDSTLFVWSFLHAVSTSTLERGVSDGRRGPQVPEHTVELGAGFAEPSSESGNMGPFEECLNREFPQHPDHSGLEYVSNQTTDVSGSASTAIFDLVCVDAAV